MKNLQTTHQARIKDSFLEGISLEKLREFICIWNSKFSIDRWWREKYKISFNSNQHRQLNLIDARIEYEEDKIYKKMKKPRPYYPGRGEWIKTQITKPMTKEEIDVAFEKL